MEIPDAAPLIVAELERLADEFKGNASACRAFALAEYSEGRANGLEIAIERIRARAAELRAGAVSGTPQDSGETGGER